MACLLAGCISTPEERLERFRYQHGAMGTLYTITLYAPDEARAHEAAEAAFARIDRLEDILSDYQADSELSLLREKPVGQPIPVSADLFTVLTLAHEIWRLTHGAFDVTVGTYTRLWRFSRKRHTLPKTEELEAARAAVGMKNLKLHPASRSVTLLVPGMRLDVGGIAKGYAADEALALLRSRGINRALIAASGDIAAGDPPPHARGWSVAIQGMPAPEKGPGKILLRNAAVSTSGDTEQFVEIEGRRYSHILDPKTGLGLTNRIQATVIAPDATLSDALATSVCILGPARGLRLIESRPHAAAIILQQHNGKTEPIESKRLRRFVIP